MTSSATAAVGGLYSFKSWYAGRLAVVVLPIVAWRMPGELGRVLAGAVLAAALVPVLGGDAAAGARRAAAGVFGVMRLAALSGLVLLGKASLPLAFAVSVAAGGAGRRAAGAGRDHRDENAAPAGRPRVPGRSNRPLQPPVANPPHRQDHDREQFRSLFVPNCSRS